MEGERGRKSIKHVRHASIVEIKGVRHQSLDITHNRENRGRMESASHTSFQPRGSPPPPCLAYLKTFHLTHSSLPWQTIHSPLPLIHWHLFSTTYPLSKVKGTHDAATVRVSICLLTPKTSVWSVHNTSKRLDEGQREATLGSPTWFFISYAVIYRKIEGSTRLKLGTFSSTWRLWQCQTRSAFSLPSSAWRSRSHKTSSTWPSHGERTKAPSATSISVHS